MAAATTPPSAAATPPLTNTAAPLSALQQLPNHVVSYLAANMLNPVDVIALANTCRAMRSSINADDALWRDVGAALKLSHDSDGGGGGGSARSATTCTNWRERVLDGLARRACDEVCVFVPAVAVAGDDVFKTQINLCGRALTIAARGVHLLSSVDDAVLALRVVDDEAMSHEGLATVLAVNVHRQVSSDFVDECGPTHCATHVFRKSSTHFRFMHIAPSGALLLERNGYLTTNETTGERGIVVRLSMCAWRVTKHAKLADEIIRLKGGPSDLSATLNGFDYSGAVGAGWRCCAHAASVVAPCIPPTSVITSVARLACTRPAALTCLVALLKAAETHMSSRGGSPSNEPRERAALLDATLKCGAAAAALKSVDKPPVTSARMSLRLLHALANSKAGSAYLIRLNALDALRRCVRRSPDRACVQVSSNIFTRLIVGDDDVLCSPLASTVCAEAEARMRSLKDL